MATRTLEGTIHLIVGRKQGRGQNWGLDRTTFKGTCPTVTGLIGNELSITGVTHPYKGTALAPGCEDIYPTVLTAGVPGQGQVRNPQTVL